MNKVELVEIVRELVRLKVKYYKLLGASEDVVVDTVIFDIYNDITNYMTDEVAEYIVDMTELDMLHMMVDKDC